MASNESESTISYRAVVNEEEQYSIWPADQALPRGWREAGCEGSRSECLDYIERVWTDMRPLSLRKHLENLAHQTPDSSPPPPEWKDEDDLVTRLSRGDHPVEVSLRPQRTARAFQAAIEQDSVRVKFNGTRGGTELNLRLDRGMTRLAGANFEAGSGKVELVGTLVLDFVPVRCWATLDLATLAGTGRLESVESVG